MASLHLGWHWLPCRYSATRDDQDGSPALPWPRWLADLGARAVAEAYDEEAGAAYRPDSAGVNFYRGDARMGMHVDREELVDDPLVSFSLGTACVFRIGNTKNPGRPYTDIELHSGDLLIFGKQNRRIYHGVPRLLPKYGNPTIERRPADVRICICARYRGTWLCVAWYRTLSVDGGSAREREYGLCVIQSGWQILADRLNGSRGGH